MRFSYILAIRTFFGGLLGFEAANYLRVFKFQIVYTWLGLILTVLVVWAVLEYLHYKSERRLHILAWILVAGAVTVDFAGEMLHWYASMPYYDKFAHAFGGAAAVLAILLYRRAQKTSLGHGEALHAAWVVMAAGYLYEFEEFAEDALTLSNRWGGWADTTGDLLANASGALVVLAFILLPRFFRAATNQDGHAVPTTRLDQR